MMMKSAAKDNLYAAKHHMALDLTRLTRSLGRITLRGRVASLLPHILPHRKDPFAQDHGHSMLLSRRGLHPMVHGSGNSQNPNRKASHSTPRYRVDWYRLGQSLTLLQALYGWSTTKIITSTISKYHIHNLSSPTRITSQNLDLL